MASRRSARLQHQEISEAQSAAGASGMVANPRMRASKSNNATKKKATTKMGGGAPSTSSKDALSSLTPELLYMVLDNVRDRPTIGKLARTSKLYYSMMMPLYYKRVAVAAAYYPQIPKLIRALEPHLTINQKTQLKEEGRYNGQQLRYPSHLDANQVPSSASFVQQLVVGWSDPGRKHEYIVHRYVEEALKNMVNLEILDLSFLTKAMSQSIASLKNLKALRLVSRNTDHENDTLAPLAKIKNLKHLSLENTGYYDLNKDNLIRSMLLNSLTTLQTLSISSNGYAASFMNGFYDIIAKDEKLSKKKYAIADVKSLALCGMSFEDELVSPLQKALDFMALRDLTIDGQRLDLILLRLADLASRSSRDGIKIKLQSLTLDMNLTDQRLTAGQVHSSINAACSFLSAFDTLTSLEIKSFQHHKTTTIDPLSTVSLLQAIRKHKNLKKLKFSYRGISSDYRVLFLRASSIAAIIENCPHLQELECAPQESEFKAIAQAISRSTNLTTLRFFPYDSCLTYPPPENCGLHIFNSIMDAYLTRDLVQDSGPFIWEDHFKLKDISNSRAVWEIASKFGKAKKGTKKAESKQTSDGARKVMYRDVSDVAFQGNMYGPSLEWLDRAENHIF